MSSLFVPPRTAAALVMQNLVSTLLQHIAFEPAEGGAAAGKPREVPLTTADLKDAFERLGVPTTLRDAVMQRLLAESLVKTDGTRVWIGNLEDLRAFLAKRQGERSSLVVSA